MIDWKLIGNLESLANFNPQEVIEILSSREIINEIISNENWNLVNLLNVIMVQVIHTQMYNVEGLVKENKLIKNKMLKNLGFHSYHLRGFTAYIVFITLHLILLNNI